jgi:uncharacterized membrane protein SpoIIM required for sporulation
VTALAPTDARALRLARQGDWLRLEDILRQAEKHSVRYLDDSDLLALPVLYRSALSSLSVARETSLDLDLVTYLEGLCARAYFFLYGVRTTPWRRAATFFVREWPAAVRSLWRETLLSALVTAAGIVAGYLLVRSDPQWFGAFVPDALGGGRDFSSSTPALRNTLYHGESVDMLSVFATALFTHNAQMSIMCFALGFAFGVPTLLLLVSNGATVGAFIALFASRGLTYQLLGWLLIHGTTELFAIVLAGAAGLRIGWSVIFPGERSRLAAAAQSGHVAARAMIGVTVMLVCAGLLEGVGRQTVTNDAARYGVGGAMLLLWLAFYYFPRPSRG